MTGGISIVPRPLMRFEILNMAPVNTLRATPQNGNLYRAY